MRFEEPQSKNRWDSELFIIKKSMDSSDEEVLFPLEDISNFLFQSSNPTPNKSTLKVCFSLIILISNVEFKFKLFILLNRNHYRKQTSFKTLIKQHKILSLCV
jgi:hypothetical protein